MVWEGHSDLSSKNHTNIGVKVKFARSLLIITSFENTHNCVAIKIFELINFHNEELLIHF